MQVITSAANYLNGKYLSGCTLYVTLEPCVMCIGAIYWARLSRIVFAAGDPKRGFQRAHIKLHPKSTLSSGIMESEAVKLLNKFFDGKRK
jgi:tRNA(adenine34) deaminase